MTSQRSPRSPDPTTIDLRADLHGHAIDFACDQDRRYFRHHPDAVSYQRPAIDHELCIPGSPCVVISPGSVIWVSVTQIAPGVRTRAVGLRPRLAPRAGGVE